MKNESSRSAVRSVADAIRRDALGKPEGELLGSEQELLERYGVSRPTLRQAAALVAQENLLKVRRGVGGGYFISRPNSKAVAHVAAIFLRSRQTTLTEIVHAIEPIRVELAKLAASCRDEKLRDSLAAFLKKEEAFDPEKIRYKDFLRQEREFGTLLEEMSGNNVISLFIEILYDFSAMIERHEDYYINRPERVENYRIRRNQLARSILEGDEEMAVIAARRCRVIPLEDDSMADGMGGDKPAEFLDLMPWNQSSVS